MRISINLGSPVEVSKPDNLSKFAGHTVASFRGRGGGSHCVHSEMFLPFIETDVSLSYSKEPAAIVPLAEPDVSLLP